MTVANGDFATGDATGWSLSGSGTLLVYSNALGFNARDSVVGGLAAQTVTTEVGQAYTLSVDVSEFGSNAGDHTLVIEIADAQGAIVATRTDVVLNASSLTLTLPFVSTTAAMTLRFLNPSSTATVVTDLIIDNVAVTPG